MLLKAALKYLEMGYSVIPCRQDKKPYIKWEFYQKRLPTESEVKSWWAKWPDANVGLVTGKVSGLCVFDQDDDAAIAYFESLMPDGLLVPTATTPRGGRHCIFKCPDTAPTNKAMINGYKLDFRGEGGYILAPPSRNGNGKGYAFLPHANIRKIAIPAMPSSLYTLVSNNIEVSSVYSSSISIKKERVIGGVVGGERERENINWFAEGRRDNDLFSVAHSLAKVGWHENDIFQVLKNLAKSWGEGDQERWFTDKIKSAMKRHEHKDKSLTDEIRAFIAVTSGDFSVTQAYNLLNLVTSCDKASARKVFSRLAKDGEIERVGAKDGIYRKVSSDIADLEKVNWRNASTESLPMKWPLGIERFVKIRPKGIIVVAGDTNAGKSAFLMNAIAMNPNMQVRCFISEGGESELADRINNSETPELFDEPRVQFFFKVSEWADHIAPNDMNVFDYLDPAGDDYIYVSEWIKNIYSRLDKGIAVIGLQKKIGSDYGTGGPKTAEKSRLYIAIDQGGTLRIVKGKDWVDYTRKPDGLQCNFKLWKGYHFSVPAGDRGWHNPKIDNL